MRQLFLTLLSLAYSAAAFAADPAHGGAEGGKEQLPQFDVTTFPSQTFWLFVTFTIVYICVKTMVMPQIGGALQKRDAHINDALQTAGTLNEKARLLQTDYEARMTTARQNAQAEVQKAKDALAAEIAQADTAQREAFTTERNAFISQFEAGKANLLKTLDEEAKTLAVQVAEKVLTGATASKKKAA